MKESNFSSSPKEMKLVGNPRKINKQQSYGEQTILPKEYDT
jgi:hypothetical protein